VQSSFSEVQGFRSLVRVRRSMTVTLKQRLTIWVQKKREQSLGAVVCSSTNMGYFFKEETSL